MQGIRIHIPARAETSGEVQFIELAMLGLVEALLADQEVSAKFAPLYRRQDYLHAENCFRDQPWRIAIEQREVQGLERSFRATARHVVEELFASPIGWIETMLASCALLAPMASLIPAQLTVTCYHARQTTLVAGVFDGLDEAIFQTIPVLTKPGRAPRPTDLEAYNRFGSWYVRHVLRHIPIRKLEQEFDECGKEGIQYKIQNGIDRISDQLNLPPRPQRRLQS
jgi:hypothetical protein